jgi:hypothetical protein
MMRGLAIAVLIFLADGCVEPYTLPPMNIKPRLVVDGLITNEPGPHTVSLSTSMQLGDFPGLANLVQGAQLTVTDDLGNTTLLTETTPGAYQTTPSCWHADLGRSYALKIRLNDGREYLSETQFLNPAGEITSLTPEVKANSIDQNDPSLPQDAVEMYMDSKGVVGTPNLFRWRWVGTYEVVAFPELHQTAVPGPAGYSLVSDPLPCSAPMTSDHQCTCCSCWIAEYSNRSLFSNNQFVADYEFKQVFLNRVPIDNRRFYTRYHFEVQQMSVSELVYSFWKLLASEQSGSTNLFQPNAVKVRGNVHATQDPNEEVFGVMAFSAITRKSIDVMQYELPVKVPPIDTVKNDCRTMNKYSSNTKPPFW